MPLTSLGSALIGTDLPLGRLGSAPGSQTDLALDRPSSGLVVTDLPLDRPGIDIFVCENISSVHFHRTCLVPSTPKEVHCSLLIVQYRIPTNCQLTFGD